MEQNADSKPSHLRQRPGGSTRCLVGGVLGAFWLPVRKVQSVSRQSALEEDVEAHRLCRCLCFPGGVHSPDICPAARRSHVPLEQCPHSLYLCLVRGPLAFPAGMGALAIGKERHLRTRFSSAAHHQQICPGLALVRLVFCSSSPSFFL